MGIIIWLLLAGYGLLLLSGCELYDQEYACLLELGQEKTDGGSFKDQWSTLEHDKAYGYLLVILTREE